MGVLQRIHEGILGNRGLVRPAWMLFLGPQKFMSSTEFYECRNSYRNYETEMLKLVWMIDLVLKLRWNEHWDEMITWITLKFWLTQWINTLRPSETDRGRGNLFLHLRDNPSLSPPLLPGDDNREQECAAKLSILMLCVFFIFINYPGIDSIDQKTLKRGPSSARFTNNAKHGVECVKVASLLKQHVFQAIWTENMSDRYSLYIICKII